MIKTCKACDSKKTFNIHKHRQFLFKKCLKCGLIFLANPPTENEMDKFYHYEDFTKLLKVIDKSNPLLGFVWKRSYLKKIAVIWGNYINSSRAASLSRIGSRNKVLLDVGCGPGVFLEYIQDLGWEVYGNEIGKNLALMAKEKVGNERIFQGKLEAVGKKLKRKKISYITLWHVFEHIYNINSVIKNVHEILNKKGWLIIEVPHSESLNFKIFRENWTLLMAPQHLHFWNIKSINSFLSKRRFVIKKVEYPVHFPFIFVSSLIKKNTIMFYLLPILLPFSMLFSLITSIFRQGDIIKIYAQKI